MLQSQLFGKTLREAPADEVSKNAILLERAGFVYKTMAGVYVYLPLGFRVLKKIEEIIRNEMIEAGGVEILMPVLQPKENWVKTGRWDSYDTLFKFASFYSKGEFVLGPTHEEIVTPLAGRFSLSYKDLPFSLFQIQVKFRDEKRAKSGLLRGREFIMKDLYSFHADEENAALYYEQMKKHYKNVFASMGIGRETYLTFASGGSFSKYSHEFQTVTDSGEDSIFLCTKCNIAVNKEIIAEQNECPECKNKNLIEKRAIEVGNIFPLKTRFSEAFALNYVDKDGKERPVVMGCYGIGPSRLMGAIVETSHDERGIIWPESVAPFRVHLLELGGKLQSKEVKNTAEKLYKDLLVKDVEVLYDDREDKSAGEKFSDADLIGIPWRVVASEKTIVQGAVELKRRNSDDAKLCSINDAVNEIKNGKYAQ